MTSPFFLPRMHRNSIDLSPTEMIHSYPSMNKHRYTSLLLALLSHQALHASTPESVPQTLSGGWQLEWHDEFSGDKLDLSKWDYELGVVRNHGSSQTYTKEAVTLEDGKLVLTTRHAETPNSRHDPKKDKGGWNLHMPSRPYSSGSVTTRRIKNFTPGSRLEIRARLPKATGAWPAIWLLGDNGMPWPTNGEIDIMEHLSQHPGLCYTTFHWGKGGERKATSKGFTRWLRYPYERFHVYAMEWHKDSIRVFVNDVEVANFDSKVATYPNGVNPFNTPAYLIINTAIGGPDTWPEQPKASDYPARFEIDYVRYYRNTQPVKKPEKKAPPVQLTY